MEWNSTISPLINNIFLLFAILGFASLAGYFCEQMGIVNIAIDGQMIFGALIYSIFGMIFNQALPDVGGMFFLIPLILSMIFSMLLSFIFGFLTIKLKTNHIIAGTAINLLVAGLAAFLTKPIGQAISSGLKSKIISYFSPTMQIAGSSLFGETIIILVISLAAMGLLWFLIARTRFGLRFKAVGNNPNAVDAQGLNVYKYQWIGMMISGALAAIAGSLFMYGGTEIGSSSQFFEGNVSGLGFLAVAIVVSGGWKISFIIGSTLIFSILNCVFQNQIILNKLGLVDQVGIYASYIGKAIPFAFSLVVLAAFSYKNVAPKFLGQNFDKSLR